MRIIDFPHFLQLQWKSMPGTYPTVPSCLGVQHPWCQIFTMFRNSRHFMHRYEATNQEGGRNLNNKASKSEMWNDHENWIFMVYAQWWVKPFGFAFLREWNRWKNILLLDKSRGLNAGIRLSLWSKRAKRISDVH